MQFEVEQKFPVAGFAAVEKSLRELAAEIGPTIEQVDCYYAHPIRDFAATDEAFRVRSTGAVNCVTYKGPKVDTTTKTRRELELALPDGTEYKAQFGLLLDLLGFRRVAEVRKRRRKAFVNWDDVRIEVSLDEVLEVGTFVELELMADESAVGQMKQHIHTLATRLGLIQNERRSYLALLLEARDK